MKDRVKRVMSEIFGVPPAEIADDATPDSVQGWDSVTQINLVMALEEEFGVAFSEEQLVELVSVELIVATVAELERAS